MTNAAISFAIGFSLALFICEYLHKREANQKKLQIESDRAKLPPILLEIRLMIRSGWKDSTYKYEVDIGLETKYAPNFQEMKNTLFNILEKRLSIMRDDEEFIKSKHEMYNINY